MAQQFAPTRSLFLIDRLINYISNTTDNNPPTTQSQTATTAPTTTATTDPVVDQKDQDRAPILLLFDVDGTLTKPRLVIKDDTWALLKEAKKKVYLGTVGGSDFPKQQEQLGGGQSDDVRQFFDYVFSENGLCAWHNGLSINDHDFKKEITEDEIQTFVNFCLIYIAGLKLPKKRGTFVEFRTGMINVSPVGRNCSQAERLEFEQYDKIHKIRENMIKEFKVKLPDLAKKLKCSIGGQISFDVFPHGWDKTYCLRFIKDRNFKQVHFFGDKTYQGGNDYEIFHDDRTIGHTVTSPQETCKFVKEILAKLDNDNDNNK